MDITNDSNTLRLENINIENASITCTVSRKYNLGNYESIDLFAALKMPIKQELSKEERTAAYSEYFEELKSAIDKQVSILKSQPSTTVENNVMSKQSNTASFDPESSETITSYNKPQTRNENVYPTQQKYQTNEPTTGKQLSDKQKKLILDLINQKKPEKFNGLSKTDLENKISNLSTKEASLLIGELYKGSTTPS